MAAIVGLGLIHASAADAVRHASPGARVPIDPPIVLIVMENRSFNEIVGNPDADYVNGRLIPNGTLFTRSHSTSDPSLPNYLALTAGSSLGCMSNDCNPGYPDPNLFRQLQRAQIPWKGWASSMPEPCSRIDDGLYARRHNPAVYYANIYPLPCKNRVVVYPDTLPDVLPRFVFIAPNLCQDMHDCGVAAGDGWLSRAVPPLRQLGALVLITFDESSGDGTHIPTLAIGPGIARGVRDRHWYTHFGVLAASRSGSVSRCSAKPRGPAPADLKRSARVTLQVRVDPTAERVDPRVDRVTFRVDARVHGVEANVEGRSERRWHRNARRRSRSGYPSARTAHRSRPPPSRPGRPDRRASPATLRPGDRSRSRRRLPSDDRSMPLRIVTGVTP